MLNINHISKSFGTFKALDSIDIHVRKGEIFGLMGPNGAGKTTLIRIINRIIEPDEGEVLLNGVAMKDEDVATLGYLPEERGLYKKMKVGDQAVYLAQLKGLSRQEAESRLHEWFSRFEIEPWWNRKVEELSKGMQQKVQFITTVLHKPQLIIFDEPFSGFDPVNAELLKEEMLRLNSEGATIILSSHNMNSIEELCSHVALLNQSHVVLSGKLEDIKQQYSGKSLSEIFVQTVKQK
ncbi:MAG: ATP-binding cassette domain-containing protein [Bacteroidales bacterium]|nr:ATP-binding cassette domain-containing protein [Candidatus Colimorpha pelethequi]